MARSSCSEEASMGPQGKLSSTSNSMQRVKVYHLNDDEKWDDRGTGHVTVDFIKRTEDLGLLVIDEEDNDKLLVHRICSDEIYKRQEDTIISWRDPELSTELALSFQEATGCSYIWDQICDAQRNLHYNTLGKLDVSPRPPLEILEVAGPSRSNDESFNVSQSELRELPPVELSTLPLILKTVVEGGVTDKTRVVELILHDPEFFPKLMDLFRMSEDLENMDDLHVIYKLVKGIVLLNSPQIFDKIFGDDFLSDIIGSLEYDPEVPQVQRHRSFLKEHVVFKEAIAIKDSLVLSKIHQTYRIGYIKDVILPRVLDEATTGSLNSIIHGNNVIVISLLKDDTSFIQELFSRMRSTSTSDESKRNLVMLLHEFCALSKSLQLPQQLRLFQDLVNEGLFDLITDALQNKDQKLVSTGADILLLFLNHDPNFLRSYIIQQEGNSLLGLLVKGLIADFGENMHCQFIEIIRILLDSYNLTGPQRDTIIEIFYEKHLNQLLDVITSSCPPKSSSQMITKSADSDGRIIAHAAVKPEILSNICELLCFCVLHHPYRIKCNFLMNNAIERVLFLTRRREKFLVVAAVRFMRTLISRNDEHLLRHIAKNNLLKPVIDAFIENGVRYNMLHSGVLELLEFIRKENLKILIFHIVDCFWDQLVRFEHLGSIRALKMKYEQAVESCNTQNTVNTVESRKRIDERALEKEEEDYFNEDSDEEDSSSARSPRTRNQHPRPNLPNGSNTSYSAPSFRPGTGGLVDYEDDEDDENYNPPPRKSSSEEDKPIVSSTSKRKSSSMDNKKDGESEMKKKRRLDQLSNDGKVVAAACSVHSSNDSHSKRTSPHNSPVDSNTNSHETNGGKESSSCIDHHPESEDSTQTTVGEKCPSTPISSSSSEIVVNSPKSEPYSVR